MKYLSFFLWIAILTLTGTFIRTRSGTSVEALTLDWLIITQLSVCMAGGAIGGFYLLRNKRWGFGGKSLLIFVVIAILSSFFNPYPTKVIGYCILLAGACLLTMQMVYSAQTLKELEQIENVWLITMTLLIFKDSATSLFLMPNQNDIYDVQRLASGVSHPNGISFMSAIAFWLTFKEYKSRFPWLLWILRIVFLIIIYLCKSRIGMLCLLLGGFIKIWFGMVRNKSSSSLYILRLASLSLIISLMLGFALAIIMQVPVFQNILDVINRGQSTDVILSASGRTYIWATAIDKIFENIVTFIFGHGYSMSRFVLNEGSVQHDWYYFHAHNLFLEVLLSMGLIGFCSLLALIFYNLKWVFNFNRLQEIYTFAFAIRAASVVLMTLAFSITEVSLAFKINPGFLIFIFYLLALDRTNALQRIQNADLSIDHNSYF